jgi:hypothetical protein
MILPSLYRAASFFVMCYVNQLFVKFLIFEFEFLIYIAQIRTVAEKASSGPGKQKKNFFGLEN